MPSRSELYTEDYVADVVTSILHPEFGSIYKRPDGEAYLAYQAGLTEGRAESTRKKKTMSESTTAKKANAPVEGVVIDSAKPLGQDYQPRDMTKGEAGFVLVLLAGVLTAVGFGIRADSKNQVQRAAEYKAEREERDAKAAAARKARAEWFDSQRRGCKVVLELLDGSYIAISSEAYAKADIKKKGQWL